MRKCPWCGYKKDIVVVVRHEPRTLEQFACNVDGTAYYRGYCTRCKALGPAADTDPEAERLWNARDGDEAK